MFFGGRSTIGLDIGSGFLKVVQLKDVKSGYELELFDMLPLAPELIVDGSIIDSLRLVEALKELTRNVIVVSSRGAEAFTYGKSILKESVKQLPRHLKRGTRVIVVNEEDECLGIASLAMDAIRVGRLSPDKLVAKNLADIGWYIRRLG